MGRVAGTRARGTGLFAVAALSIAGLLLVAQPPGAAAQASPDASCPGPPEGTYGSSPGDSRFAQTFTAQAGGALTMAQADVFKQGTPADWIMHINEVDGTATPTNTVLASATIPDSTVPAGASTLTGNFATPATVIAGQQYALVVTRPGAGNVTMGIRSGDDCPGQLFESTSQTGTFFLATAPFQPSFDMVFTVFVEPPALPDTTAAQITGAMADPKKFAVDKQGPAETEVPLVAKGTTFRYNLSEPAQVKFSIFRQVKKKGKKKLKPVGAFTAQGEAGQNAKPFSGRIGNKKLKPGKYVANLTATDAAGNVSSPATISFKVVEAKK
ncbi:MAG TPA: hypothetical protein VEK39_04955 [Solirubrobacterales bacterium]|nr:hypothetical protein [Solirubrobacterales bacterium]